MAARSTGSWQQPREGVTRRDLDELYREYQGMTGSGPRTLLETQTAIELADRYGTVGRLRFSGETILYEGGPLLLLPTGEANTSALVRVSLTLGLPWRGQSRQQWNG